MTTGCEPMAFQSAMILPKLAKASPVTADHRLDGDSALCFPSMDARPSIPLSDALPGGSVQQGLSDAVGVATLGFAMAWRQINAICYAAE
jgi:hypothetical protein